MGIEFRTRDFFHPWSIWKLHRFLEHSQWFDAQELANYQDLQMRRMVRHAYENVPYYRDLFDSRGVLPGDIQRASDLACLPRLSKSTLRRERARLRASNADQYGAFEVATSGTTGHPVSFLLDRYANTLEFAYYWRWFGWSGYRLGDRLAELTSAYFLARPARLRWPFQLQRSFGRLLLNTVEMSHSRVAEFVTALRRYRPEYLKGTPSAVSQFASMLRALGVDDVRFRAVFCTGEMLLTGTRRLIADILRSPVFDSYGHMERTVAICECPAGSLHVNPEYGILEIADDIGVSETNVRRGIAVGTGLHCFAMPLLRYETGDVIVYEVEPPSCSCGRSMPRVLRVDGRLNDSVVTPDGRVITALFLVIDQFAEITRGQIIQDSQEHLLVRVVPRGDWSTDNEEELVRRIREFVGETMRISVECGQESSIWPSPDTKWRTVISKLAPAEPEELTV